MEVVPTVMSRLFSDLLEQLFVPRRSASKLHHCPSAAEDGLAAAGHYNPKLINVQILELQVLIKQITHNYHLVAD
jgi:hypothetical protein